MNSTLAKREMGNIPISIATSLAFEGLYNRHPDRKPERVLPASKAKVIYINARTLFRNIYRAVDERSLAERVSAQDYANCLLEEVDELSAFLKQESHPLELVLYLPSYRSLAKYMGNGELRPLSTDLQKQYNQLENGCLTEILKQYKNEEVKPFLEVDMEIEVKEYQDIFLLSHLPMDLLNVKNAADIYLVESHTGVVKGKELWYTKLHANKEESIPFNKATVLFFGDSGMIFKPQNHKSRSALVEVSKKRKWNAYTTKDRMLIGLEVCNEPYLIRTIRELFK